MKKEFINYESPKLELVEVDVEQGFAASFGEQGLPGNGFGLDNPFGPF